MPSTRNIEPLFTEKLEDIRRRKREIESFKGLLSVVGRGFVQRVRVGVRFHPDIEMFGDDINDPILNNYTTGVLPLLIKAVNKEYVHYVWHEKPIRSTTGLIEAWSHDNINEFNEQACMYWDALKNAGTVSHDFCDMFCSPNRSPNNFADAFPLASINTKPAAERDSGYGDVDTDATDATGFTGFTTELSEECDARNVDNMLYEFDETELNQAATSLCPAIASIWRAAEKVRDKRRRMLVDVLHGTSDDIANLRREIAAERNTQMHHLLIAQREGVSAHPSKDPGMPKW